MRFVEIVFCIDFTKFIHFCFFFYLFIFFIASWSKWKSECDFENKIKIIETSTTSHKSWPYLKNHSSLQIEEF